MRKKKKINLVSVVGKTPNGNVVLGGIYRFMETYGVPLDIICEFLKDQNPEMIVSWFHVLNEAMVAGTNMERFKERLKTDIIFVYGNEYWEEIANIINKAESAGILYNNKYLI